MMVPGMGQGSMGSSDEGGGIILVEFDQARGELLHRFLSVRGFLVLGWQVVEIGRTSDAGARVLHVAREKFWRNTLQHAATHRNTVQRLKVLKPRVAPECKGMISELRFEILEKTFIVMVPPSLGLWWDANAEMGV